MRIIERLRLFEIMISLALIAFNEEAHRDIAERNGIIEQNDIFAERIRCLFFFYNNVIAMGRTTYAVRGRCLSFVA